MNSQTPQLLILLRGGLGSGKTTVGRLVRDSLPRAVSISLNILHSFISSEPLKNKTLAFESALVLADFFLRRNFSVILDELFIFPETTKPFFDLGEKYKIPVFLFELEVSPEGALKRYRLEGIKQRTKENIQGVLTFLSGHPISWAQKIDTNRYSPTQIRDLILESIRNKIEAVR